VTRYTELSAEWIDISLRKLGELLNEERSKSEATKAALQRVSERSMAICAVL
jgi:hypothetical protein